MLLFLLEVRIQIMRVNKGMYHETSDQMLFKNEVS